LDLQSFKKPHSVYLHGGMQGVLLQELHFDGENSLLNRGIMIVNCNYQAEVLFLGIFPHICCLGGLVGRNGGREIERDSRYGALCLFLGGNAH
jgi:hypothetical protein